MHILQALPAHLDFVRQITQQTIAAVYPHYYPAGAVRFFAAHHSDSAIADDIADGLVWLLRHDDCFVGTVTIRQNALYRLFVLPQWQGQGFGTSLLDFSEARILRDFPQVTLDASLPAETLYQKRGYRITGFYTIPCDGDFLCYHTMALPARNKGTKI